VAECNPLGLAGAAGGVEDQCGVRFGTVVRDGACAGFAQRCPATRVVVNGNKQALADRAIVQAAGLLQQGKPLGGRDQPPCTAVTEDVLHLCRLQGRVHRYRDAARTGNGEQGGNGLRALFQVNRDAVAGGESTVAKAGCRVHDVAGQLGVGPLRALCPQGHGVGRSGRRSQRNVVEQGGHVRGPSSGAIARKLTRRLRLQPNCDPVDGVFAHRTVTWNTAGRRGCR